MFSPLKALSKIRLTISTARLVVLKKPGLHCYAASKLLVAISIIILLVSGAVFYTGWCSGFEEGFEVGRKEVNQWWIDQKSTYYDTDKILKERFSKGYDCA
jgi:hypothetical protein